MDSWKKESEFVEEGMKEESDVVPKQKLDKKACREVSELELVPSNMSTFRQRKY